MRQNPHRSWPLRAMLVLLLLTPFAACSNAPAGQTGYFGYDGGFGGLPPRNFDTMTAKDMQGQTSADGSAWVDGQATSDGEPSSPDAAVIDAGATDGAAVDGGIIDSGVADGGIIIDSGVADSGVADSGVADSSIVDSGVVDSGPVDVGQPDVGKPDAGGSIFGEDIPWGSDPNAPPFDAGQWDYDILSGGGPGPGLCNPAFSEIDLEKKEVGGKVDIIAFVDTSGSMGQEAKYMNAQMNNFANYLVGANIDFRVILLEKDTGCCKMCIQPPLGGPNCSNNAPKFIHHKGIAMPVYSKDGLKDVIQSYPAWKQWLRPDATKNFLAVTDDNSSLSSAAFISQLNALNIKDKPQQFQKTAQVPYGFVFHSIVAYPTKSQCPTMASHGTVYLDLTAKTKGAKFKICEKNWAPIFKDLAKAVSMTAKPGCTYPLQKPAGVVSSDDLSLVYVAEDDDFPVPLSPGNTCPANGVGFTFDNPSNPAKVTLCPGSCGKLNGGGNLIFNFGCG